MTLFPSTFRGKLLQTFLRAANLILWSRSRGARGRPSGKDRFGVALECYRLEQGKPGLHAVIAQAISGPSAIGLHSPSRTRVTAQDIDQGLNDVTTESGEQLGRGDPEILCLRPGALAQRPRRGVSAPPRL